MPTKRLTNPIFESAFNCLVMPSFWSMNHQAEPHCTLPAMDPSLKFPIIVAITSLSEGLLLYNIVLARWLFLSREFKKEGRDDAWGKSPMESHPVSGPSIPSIRLLLFRKAPK